MESAAFRVALGRFATGVTVVTTLDPRNNDIGVTANSFNSVSLDPPMVLWSLAKSARSVDAFTQCQYFAVHVLSSAQDAVSARFSKSGVNKFEGLDLERGLGGVPLLRECSARFQCRRAFVHEGGDHLIIVGEVEEFDHQDRPPLVFHRGAYALAVERKSAPPPDLPAAGEVLGSSFSQDFLIYLLGRAHYQLFQSLQRDLARHELSEDEWFALSILGASGTHTIDDIDRVLRNTGKRVTYELFARLATLGLVELIGGHDPGASVVLTERGQATVVELVAIAKGAESDAERSLGNAETLLLKSALRVIIKNTQSGTTTRVPQDD